jgi:type II secretory pathway pseudopilin PulG
MSSSRHREAGVSVVEMLVVLVVIGVLLGLMLTSMRGSKDTSGKAVGRAVASAYYEVAVDFASDNGGAVPKGGSAAWPSARIELGPMNFLNKSAQQRYLRHVPEAVTDGRVRLVADGVSSGARAATLTVTYSVTGPQTFEIIAARQGTPYCQLANGPTRSALPQC